MWEERTDLSAADTPEHAVRILRNAARTYRDSAHAQRNEFWSWLAAELDAVADKIPARQRTRGRRGRRQTQQADREAFAARVRSALKTAHAAAASAANEVIKQAPRDSQGLVRDLCGSAVLTVRNPSYRLRTTLKAMGEIEPGYGRRWHISNFSRDIPDGAAQSKTACEDACWAAYQVFIEEFPGEGEFEVVSRID